MADTKQPIVSRGRFSGTREISAEIRKLIPVLGYSKAANLERAYLLGDDNTRVRIISLVDALKAATFRDEDFGNSMLIEPPSKEECEKGDIHMGDVVYGRRKLYPFMFSKSHLLTHMGVFGSSGYGKTNLIQHLTKLLAAENIPIIIFDFSKMNYRDLIAVPEFRDRMFVYTVGREVSPFRFNPLIPPDGVSVTQWAKEFAEVFDHAYWLMGGGKHIILKALDDIYDRARRVPKIKDLRSWVVSSAQNSTSAREKNWVATAERPLESLNFRDTGKIFDTERGVMPSDFLKPGKITVLELDAMSPSDRTFIIEIILQWLRDWLLLHGTREDLKAVVVLEEAHHLVNREKTNKLGTETVIDLLFREIRELGIGIIYTDQHPSMISYPALGNTSTHVYMNLGLDSKQNSDIQDASNMLGINYQEEGQFIRKMPVGNGFVMCRRLAFTSPFQVEFPHVNVTKGSVTDAKLIEMLGLDVPGEESKDRFVIKPENKRDTIYAPRMNEKQWEMIRIIGSASGYSTSMIYKAAGCSGTVFKEQISKLIELGLVGMKEGKVYKQKSHYYFLTPSGMAVFEKRFVSVKPVEEEIEVEYYSDFFKSRGFVFIKKVNENVFEVEKEGKEISLYFESTSDYDRVFSNVSACSDRVYVVASSERVRNAVIQGFSRLAAENGDSRSNIVIFIACATSETRNFARIEFFHYDSPVDVTYDLINNPALR